MGLGFHCQHFSDSSRHLSYVVHVSMGHTSTISTIVIPKSFTMVIIDESGKRCDWDDGCGCDYDSGWGQG